MKNIITSLLLLTAMLGVNANAALTLQDITGIPGTSGYTDTGSEYLVLTDNDGVNDDATAFLFLELAGFADTNAVGIYEFSKSGADIILGDTLEVFSGAISPISSATIAFNLAAGTATANGVTANIDGTFGVYLQTAGGTFYTHSFLNGGADQALTFDTTDNTAGGLYGSDAVIAWEDLPRGSTYEDGDFNDLVIGISDVKVPEPGVIALFGLGLLGFGVARIKARKS